MTMVRGVADLPNLDARVSGGVCPSRGSDALPINEAAAPVESYILRCKSVDAWVPKAVL